MQEFQKHPKNDFLIERICYFSDAVFAIAITLMILEIHPPVIERSDTSGIVWQKLGKKIPEFLGLLISFWLIGSVWLRHHQLFAHIERYDLGLLMINLALLFIIILFPFSTSFLFNSLFEGIVTKPQVIFYLMVPLLANLILYFMYKMAFRKYIESLKDHAGQQFHRAVHDQGFMIISFILALAWVLIVPFAIHAFGYFFLVLGPIGIAFKPKSNKKRIATSK